MPATTPRSWVMTDDGGAVVCRQALHEMQYLRLDGDVQGRGGLVGHQQRGLQLRAMAIMTRWRMPPLNWCG